MKLAVLFAALAVAPALAGCVDEPGTPAAKREAAPALEAGFRWSYTIHAGNGSHIGSAAYEVLSRTTIGGRSAYRVGETFAHPSLAGELRKRELHWDAATLNLVSPACDVTCPTRGRDLDFPLEHEKSWVDGLREATVNASYREDAEPGPTGFAKLWVVEARPLAATGQERTVRLYAPEAGVVVQRTDYDRTGAVDEEWRLAEFDFR